MRYWARYADRISWEAGEPATTVVRQHDETGHAESFRSWGGWAPTQVLDDLADARPSSPAHLVEIDAEEADRLLAAAFGVRAATGLSEPVLRMPELLGYEAESVRGHWVEAGLAASEAAGFLDDVVASLADSHGARRVEGNGLKSAEALLRQVAVARSEGVPLPVALRAITDVVRFTLVFDTRSYTDGMERTTALLQNRGYTMIPGSAVSSWENPTYKDCRSAWHPPQSGVGMEIQFHTPESLRAKTVNQHLHEFDRQNALWPTGVEASQAAAFVRQSSWWTTGTAENGPAIAALLGFGSIEEALRGLVTAAERLGYLIDVPISDLRALVLLRRVLVTIAQGLRIPQASEFDEVEDAIVALARGMVDGDVLAEAAGFGVPEAADATRAVFEICCRAAQLLFGAVIIARGDLDGNTATARPVHDKPTNGSVAAAVLGLNVEAMKADPDLAANRLAYLLGLPVRDEFGLRVVGTVLETFVEEAHVPPAGRTEELVEETDRVAARATPLDPELYRKAADAFGVPDLPQDGAGVYKICSRTAVFLFKAVLITRFD
ncbi:hypothetical protein AB0N05_33900 [Nocardia sp. NPDC051030]|uniref:hypothetical protein n=1 Tax=Nocardia sp. NPDC051030 TaxID=3155162 RepID=UPI003419E00A